MEQGINVARIAAVSERRSNRADRFAMQRGAHRRDREVVAEGVERFGQFVGGVVERMLGATRVAEAAAAQTDSLLGG